MILSNTEIEKAISEGRIIFDPSPKRPFDTTAVDLRLDQIIRVQKEELCATFKSSDRPIADTLHAFFNERVLKDDDTFELKPQKFVPGQTLEKINLQFIPDQDGHYLAARIEDKSSRARCGMLVHFTAPTIHAGFKGHLCLEIINLSNLPITLNPDMAICQLIFERVLGKPQPNPSHFQCQTNPAGYS